MMKFFTQPGVSIRNWLMAWKVFRSGCSKSINFTTGSASPVTSLTSTCALKSSFWIASFDSSSVRFGCRRIWLRRSSSCRSVSHGLSARTASRKTPGSSHSRKLSRRLAAGAEGIIPQPWSTIVHPSAASWSRKGFSTWWYSDIGRARTVNQTEIPASSHPPAARRSKANLTCGRVMRAFFRSFQAGFSGSHSWMPRITHSRP